MSGDESAAAPVHRSHPAFPGRKARQGVGATVGDVIVTTFRGGEAAARNERGSAAVEFAILLPLLAAILFGIVEFSLIMYDKAVITSASREGARFGSLFKATRPTCAQIYSGSVQAYEQNLFAWGGVAKTIAVNCFQVDTAGAASAGVCPGTATGERLAVETVFAYGSHQLIAPFTGPVTLRSTTIMNCE